MEKQNKIDHHLSGAWRDSGNAPSPDYFFQPATTSPDQEIIQVENPNHRLAATFGPQGLTLHPQLENEFDPFGNPAAEAFASDWSFHLQLTGLGYQGAVHPVGAGVAAPDHGHLEYHRPKITEWYTNSPAGLEHGFTLDTPPAGRHDPTTPLRFELALASNLHPRVTDNGTALQMENTQGTTVLRYEKLLAFDATGREQPARMELADHSHLALLIDDRAAQYPIVVDPVIVGLVKDINPVGFSSNPSSFAVMNGMLYFSADDGITGAELWKSDGTEAGTVLVKDINPGNVGSGPSNLTPMGNALYFRAGSASTGNELWKSDGTEAGTALVKDIHPGTGSGLPSNLTAMGNTLYFSASNSSFGTELWKSDGTEEGTVVVKDINPGGGSSSPAALAFVGTLLYFSATDGVTGNELWKSDGTEAGTVLLKDINPGNGSSGPSRVTAIGSTFFFIANNGTAGQELWKSDGTEPGTVIVKDINIGSGSSFPSNLTVSGSILYFSADNGGSGFELWKSDGTEAGTILVKDITGGSSSPSDLTVVNSTIYFTANNAATGRELWRSDGTEAGTTIVKDINTGSGSSSPASLVVIGTTLYFSATDGVTGNELWKSDGTPSSTMIVKDIRAGSNSSFPQSLIVAGSTIFLSVDDGITGRELWRSDGTELGTFRIKDIDASTMSSTPFSIIQRSAVANGNVLFFSASDGITGNELWKSDGTETGTLLVKDINPGSAGSNPVHLTTMDGIVYFTATDSATGNELWRSDGTEAGTIRVRDIRPGSLASTPADLTAVDGTLFFTANDGATGTELWKSNGTEAGTVRIKDIRAGSLTSSPTQLTALNGALFFTATDGSTGLELWKSDGTEAGTVLLKDINPGSGSSSPDNLTAMGSTLYFSANDGTYGQELWMCDGTETGTALLKDIHPGSGSSSPGNLTAIGNTLYFSATDGTTGIELWKTDGKTAGTLLVRDIFPGAFSSVPVNLRAFGGTLFFTASTIVSGSQLSYNGQLWKSDGTEAGTILVKDIRPEFLDLPQRRLPTNLTVHGSRLFFTADDGATGLELWKSDGTEAGTELVADIRPGPAGSSPASLVAVGNKLFFTADDGIKGSELWMAFEEVDEENRAPIDLAISSGEVMEHLPAGTGVGTFATTDTDAGDTHSYALVSGLGDADNLSFAIAGSQLRTAAVFDYESQSSMSIRVRTTDSGGLFLEKVFIVQVLNVNDPPGVVNPLTDAAGDYGQPFVLTFPANTFADPDVGQTMSYAVSGLPPGIGFDGPSRTFSGQPAATGGFVVTVTATDSGSPALSVSDQFELFIHKGLLDVAANGGSRTYGQVNPVLMGTLMGVVNGDPITASYTTSATTTSPVGMYAIVPSLHDHQGRLVHYVVGMSEGTLTVTGALATVTANPKTRDCGSGFPVLDAVVVGEVSGGDSIQYTLQTTATEASGGGSYPITVVLGANPNYIVTAIGSTLTVAGAGPPAIVLSGANPLVIPLGTAYAEPGATASDACGGDLTASIVIDASDVDTVVPGDYFVTYNVSDPFGNAAPEVTRLVIVGANAPPEISDSPDVLIQQDAVLGPLTVTVSDPDEDPLSLNGTSSNQDLVPDANIAIEGTGNERIITITPVAGGFGSTLITLTASDGTATAIDTFTLTVNGQPVPTADLLGTREDESATVVARKFALNDSDPDGDALTITAVSGSSAEGGTVVLENGSIVYTPAGGFVGDDSFTYTVTDARAGTATGTVHVTVTSKDAQSLNGLIRRTADGFALTFFGIPGNLYIIQFTDAMNEPWKNLTDPVAAGPSGRIEYEDTPVPLPDERYYRTISVP